MYFLLLMQLSLNCLVIKCTYAGYCILYCKPYSTIVFTVILWRHLGDIHFGVSVKLRQQITNIYKADINDLVVKDAYAALLLL